MANSRELAQFASFVNFTGSSIGLTTQINITGISTFDNAVIFDSTGYIQVPAGNTAQRNVTGISVTFGQVRYNTQLSQFEGFGAGDAWGSLGGVKDVDGDTFIRAESAAGEDEDKLEFLTGDTTRVVIDSTGQVGIGTTNPQTLLDVDGDSTFRGNVDLLDDDKLRFGASQDLQIYHDATDSIIDNTNGDLYLKTTGSGDDIIIRAADDVIIQTQGNEGAIVARGNGTVELYYDGSKKLETTGIGVSVSNGTASTATIAAPANLIIDPGVVGDDTGIVRIKGDLFVDGTTTQINSTTLEIADFIVGIASTATTDLLTDGAGIKIGPDNTFLYEHNGGTNSSLKSSENLNVASGKVYQIGETERLSTDTLSVGTGATVHSPDSNVLTLGTNNSERLRITSDGLVGINSTSPATALDIQSTKNGDGLTITRAGTPSAFLGHNGSGNEGLLILREGGTNKIQLYAESGQNSFINTGGSVGIGTNNPQRKLVVSDNGTEGLEFFPGDAVNGSTINVYNRATSAFTPFSLNAQDYRFNPSGGTEALRITSDGKVGIGTDNPEARLDVYDTSGLGILSRSANTQATDTNKGLKVRNNSSTDTFNVSYKGQGYFAGKVGIGTDDPGATKLKIETGSGTRAISLNAPTNGTYITFETAGTAYADIGAEKGVVGSGSTDTPVINARGSRDLAFRTNNAERLRITSDGSVGIGKTDPSGKLEVNGGYVTLRSGASSYPDGISAPIIYGTTGGGSNSFDQTGNLVLQTRSDAGSYNICMVTGDTPTERLRITSAGKIGIGTDNPTSILTVVSPSDEVAVFQSTFGDAGPNISLTHKGGSPNDDDTVGSIAFNGQGDPAPGDAGGFSLVSYAAIKVISTDVTKDSEDGAITFTTKNVDGFNEKLRITSVGDLQRPKSLSQEVSTSVSSTSATSCGSFAKATYRSAYVIAQITQGTSYQVGRYLVIHDGTTATTIEESAIATGDMLGTFEGVINGSNVEFRVTMSSASSATVITKIESIVV